MFHSGHDRARFVLWPSLRARSDVLLRTAGDPQALLPAFRSRVGEVLKDRAAFDIQPLESRVGESVWDRRVLASIMGAFAIAALATPAAAPRPDRAWLNASPDPPPPAARKRSQCPWV